MPMKKITYHKKAIDNLLKMPKNWRLRILAKIEQYADNPQSLANNVIRMKGEPHYRLRVGDYRVVFDDQDTVIDVIRVDSRGNVYKK